MERSCLRVRSQQAVKATARYLLSRRSRVRGSSIVISSTPRSHPSALTTRCSQPPHREATSVYLPPHPAVAYLFLVRRLSNTREQFQVNKYVEQKKQRRQICQRQKVLYSA